MKNEMDNSERIKAAAEECADYLRDVRNFKLGTTRDFTELTKILRKHFGESAPEQKEELERVQRSGMFYHLIGPCPKCGKTLLLNYGHHSGKSRGRDNFKWTVMHEHNASAWCDEDRARFADMPEPLVAPSVDTNAEPRGWQEVDTLQFPADAPQEPTCAPERCTQAVIPSGSFRAHKCGRLHDARISFAGGKQFELHPADGYRFECGQIGDQIPHAFVPPVVESSVLPSKSEQDYRMESDDHPFVSRPKRPS